MEWIENRSIVDAAVAVFILLFVISRVVSRSSLKLLDANSKVKLVDENARSGWFYAPLIVVFALMFWRFGVGVIALSVYVVFGMFYNSWSHYRNEMPLAFQTRIMVSNALLLTGFFVMAMAFLFEMNAV